MLRPITLSRGLLHSYFIVGVMRIMCVQLQGSFAVARKGGSPGCSLVAVLITSFGQAGGFDVRPITSTCYMACANTIFVRGVLLSHVGSGSRLRRRYSKGCPMKYFVQCWCCPLYWIYSLCLLSFFLATWWKGGVRAAPTT